MSYLGDINLGDTLDFKFTTTSATTGAPTTLAGTPVISVYEDNSTTQITAGITLTVDFDAVTGMNHVRIVASGGNGFGSGQNYQAVITTGTVGGTSAVGYVVAEFSIDHRSALRPTTSGRTLDVTAGGNAGIDWANIEAPTTSVTFTNTTIATVTANTDMRGTDNAFLAANAPANFSSLGITAGGNASINWGDVENPGSTVNLSSTTINLCNTVTTNTDMRGTDNALLASSAPANFGDLSITASTGLVDITQVAADKAWSTTTRVLTANTNLNDITVNDIFTGQMTESYAADGVAPTLAQCLFLSMQNLQDFVFSGTTQTVRQIDGVTTAATYTLDDATNPTSKTRST